MQMQDYFFFIQMRIYMEFWVAVNSYNSREDFLLMYS